MDIIKHLKEITVATLVIELALFFMFIAFIGPIIFAAYVTIINTSLTILHLKARQKFYIGYIIFLMLPVVLMVLLLGIISSIGKMC